MYSHVFVAGTFEHFHTGHQSFLTHAFEVGDRVTIGVTSDSYIKKFKDAGQTYQSYLERQKRLSAWLSDKDFENRVALIPIHDPYEPAASMDDLDAILVTRDNRSRGEEINKKRAGKNIPELTLIEVPMTEAQDAKPISSTRVRNGEIDRAGRLILPDNLRPELARPLGTILVGDSIGSSIETHRNGIIITVGDITTKTFLTAGVVPSLSIVDFLVARKPFPELDTKLKDLKLYHVTIKSGPGFIAQEAIELIKKWSTHPKDTMVMVVAGEEDLLTLPVLAYGPLPSVVFYGQPDKGMVEVQVTQERQIEAVALLEKFQK